MLGRFMCWITRRHKRGVLLVSVFDARIGKQVLTYACPRCGRRTVYKANSLKVPG